MRDGLCVPEQAGSRALACSEERPHCHPRPQLLPFRKGRFDFRLPRLDRHEISGSLGDLGTFIPLLVGMSVTNGLDFTSALFFAGLFNIVTGLAFSIPMAVQPMKAIAAVAIAEQLTLGQILAAGISTSLVIFILGVTGLITVVNRAIPKPVVRGLQLGLGLQLLEKGVLLVRDTHVLWGFDSISIGILGFALVLAFASSRKVPSALDPICCGIGTGGGHQSGSRLISAAGIQPAPLGTVELE